MKQIIPHSFWLGHAGEGRDYRQVFQAGIKALVELAMEEPPSQPPRELIYCRFPLLDSPGNSSDLLNLTISTLAALVRERTPTLVCCANGISRAPALTAAALSRVLDLPPDECLRRVLAHHPSDVSPGLWTEVVEFLAGTKRT